MPWSFFAASTSCCANVTESRLPGVSFLLSILTLLNIMVTSTPSVTVTEKTPFSIMNSLPYVSTVSYVITTGPDEKVCAALSCILGKTGNIKAQNRSIAATRSGRRGFPRFAASLPLGEGRRFRIIFFPENPSAPLLQIRPSLCSIFPVFVSFEFDSRTLE